MKTGRPRLVIVREKFAELMTMGWTVASAAKALRVNRTTASRWRDQMGFSKRFYKKEKK